MAQISQPAGAGERRWRRRALLTLPLLLPLAAAALGANHLYWLWHGSHIVAREVAAGETAVFGGSEWTLTGLVARPEAKPAAVPPGFTLLVADLSVKVGSAHNALKVGDTTFEQLWGACQVGVVDGQGRRWSAAKLGYTPALYPARQRDIATCGSHSLSKQPPEAVLTVREAFLVPRDVAPSVRPTLSLDGEQPYYLVFQRR
ncbi:hypothetical protein [Chelatococcus reniformis]|uniref:Uncharacterized protein n=1 Tax=Chelatococcus reniformis TaxID=1494448 RepID=A0A916ULR4_9HYPH|nr:hypothetical protein [Chelatococcus reniformis]GGC75774.1 hypothetical protein GCM10010994_37750 [Chelatococcus reniformis]